MWACHAIQVVGVGEWKKVTSIKDESFKFLLRRKVHLNGIMDGGMAVDEMNHRPPRFGFAIF